MMTTIGNEQENIHEIKIKSISIVNRLIKFVAIEKKNAFELQQLELIYSRSSEVKNIKPNVVYVCKIQRGYERCCVYLESEDNLSKSLTVFLIDCDSEEAQVSLDQVSKIKITASHLSPLNILKIDINQMPKLYYSVN